MSNIVNSFDELSLNGLITNVSTIVHALSMAQEKREMLQQLFSEIEIRIENQDIELVEIAERIERTRGEL